MGPGSDVEPPFEQDPFAWLSWVDRLLTDSPDRLRNVRPSNIWVDDAGHGWRVVATPDGPEVRPCLENPFLVHGPLPRITAICVTERTLAIELTSREFREVDEVALGRVRVRDLGVAMLTRTELPHHGIERVDEDTWALARSRWRAMGRPMEDQLDPDDAPAAGPETQNRAVRPVA
jgi:hypothetical protein